MLKTTFIVNPISGTLGDKKKVTQLLRKHLDAERFDAQILFTEYAGHAVELSQQARDAGQDLVVAVGGDGSVNEVARPLIHSRTCLGVLPGGSGNGFATHIGMRRNLTQAIRQLNTAQPQCIDTATLNGMPFLSFAGVGFAAKIAYLSKNSQRRGFLNYFQITMREAWGVEFFPYEISLDGQAPFSRKCLMLELANSSTFGYQFQPAPMASLEDGLLNLVVVKKAPIYRYFLSVPLMVSSRIHKAYYMEYFTCKKVSVRIPEGHPMHLDGEGMWAQNTQWEGAVVPKSLWVWVPGQARAEPEKNR